MCLMPVFTGTGNSCVKATTFANSETPIPVAFGRDIACKQLPLSVKMPRKREGSVSPTSTAAKRAHISRALAPQELRDLCLMKHVYV